MHETRFIILPLIILPFPVLHFVRIRVPSRAKLHLPSTFFLQRSMFGVERVHPFLIRANLWLENPQSVLGFFEGGFSVVEAGDELFLAL